MGGAALLLLLQPALAIVLSGMPTVSATIVLASTVPRPPCRLAVLRANLCCVLLQLVCCFTWICPHSCCCAVALGGSAGYLLSKLLRVWHAGSATLHQHPHPSHSPAADSRHALSGGSGRLPAPVSRLLRHPAAARLRPAAPLLVAASTFAAAEALGAEPLLTCVAAGLVASNWR